MFNFKGVKRDKKNETEQHVDVKNINLSKIDKEEAMKSEKEPAVIFNSNIYSTKNNIIEAKSSVNIYDTFNDISDAIIDIVSSSLDHEDNTSIAADTIWNSYFVKTSIPVNILSNSLKNIIEVFYSNFRDTLGEEAFCSCFPDYSDVDGAMNCIRSMIATFLISNNSDRAYMLNTMYSYILSNINIIGSNLYENVRDAINSHVVFDKIEDPKVIKDLLTKTDNLFRDAMMSMEYEVAMFKYNFIEAYNNIVSGEEIKRSLGYIEFDGHES